MASMATVTYSNIMSSFKDRSVRQEYGGPIQKKRDHFAKPDELESADDRRYPALETMYEVDPGALSIRDSLGTLLRQWRIDTNAFVYYGISNKEVRDAETLITILCNIWQSNGYEHAPNAH